jgi:ParB/RepB/Spo0J family partition protein
MTRRRRTTVQAVSTAPPALPIAHLLPEPRQEIVDLDQVDPSPLNKRVFREGDPKDRELLANLRAMGQIIVPLILRPIGDRFDLIAGERRVRFAREAGILRAPALVYDIDDLTANRMRFVENFFRSDLHYLQEAEVVAGLMVSGCSQEMIAAQLGMPVKWVALRAHLTNLSPTWRELIGNPDLAVGLWSASHMEVIALLSQPAQDGLLKSHEYLLDYVPAIDDLRSIVSEQTLQLAGSPWSLDDETLCPEAGACSACPLRSSVHPTLFEDLGERTSDPKDRCLDRACWKNKLNAFLARQEAELRQTHPNLVLLTTTGAPKPGVFPAWQTRPAKKKQGGAVPAFVLDGSDCGKLRWVLLPEPSTPTTHSSSTPSAASPVAPVPGQRAKSSLAERQALLDRRRKLQATETIRVAVKESDQVPPLATVLALAFVFGTHQTLSTGSYCSDGLLLESFPGVNEPASTLPLWRLAEDLGGSASALDDLGPRLWRRVLPVLLMRTTNVGSPDDILRAYEEARKLAALVGIDSDEHLELATAKLPDPASWAAEKAAIARAADDPTANGPSEDEDHPYLRDLSAGEDPQTSEGAAA